MESTKLNFIFLVTLIHRSLSARVTFFGANGIAKSYDLKGGCDSINYYYGSGEVDFFGEHDSVQARGQWSVVADIPECPASFKWSWQATKGRYEELLENGGKREINHSTLNESHVVVYSQLGQADIVYGIGELSEVVFVLGFELGALVSKICGRCVNPVIYNHIVSSSWYCLPPGNVTNGQTMVVAYLPTGCEFVYRWKLQDPLHSSEIHGNINSWLKAVRNCDDGKQDKVLVATRTNYEGKCVERRQLSTHLTTTIETSIASNGSYVQATSPSGSNDEFLCIAGPVGGGVLVLVLLSVLVGCLCRKCKAKVELQSLESHRKRESNDEGQRKGVDPTSRLSESYCYVDDKEAGRHFFRKTNVVRNRPVSSAEYEGMDPSGYADNGFRRPEQVSSNLDEDLKLQMTQEGHYGCNYVNDLPSMNSPRQTGFEGDDKDYMELEDAASYCTLGPKEARQEHTYQTSSAVRSRSEESRSPCQKEEGGDDKDYVEVEEAASYCTLDPKDARQEHTYQSISK